MGTSSQLNNSDAYIAGNSNASHLKSFMPNASEKARIITAAVIVGVLAGVAAALLKNLIGLTAHTFEGLVETSGGRWWPILIIPIVGIVLTGMYQRYVLKASISHGVDRLVNDLDSKTYLLKPNRIYGPIIASTLTLGLGGSAGSEGPIAYSGAAIGSNIGRVLGLNSDQLYVLVSCGAAAGIAGIFKAPVGGMLFAVEVLAMTLTTVSFIALLASTLCGALTAYILSGFTFDIAWRHNTITFDPSTLPWIIALGIFCGLYSVYYSNVMKGMKKTYESIKNPWLENIISGAVLAVSLFLFPSLFGEGYSVVGSVLNLDTHEPFRHSILAGVNIGEWTLPLVLLGILMVKSFACSASNSGGGVAGDFAPTLFAGCIAGLFFATTCNQLFGQTLTPQVYAYIAMTGVMSGVIRAPLMSIFLVAEMCNGFDYLLPLVIVSALSYAMVMGVTHTKFYRRHEHVA